MTEIDEYEISNIFWIAEKYSPLKTSLTTPFLLKVCSLDAQLLIVTHCIYELFNTGTSQQLFEMEYFKKARY